MILKGGTLVRNGVSEVADVVYELTEEGLTLFEGEL